MNLRFLSKASTLFLLSIAMLACNNDEDDNGDPAPQQPNTYAGFENVDYSGQTTRLNMLEEITTYMKTANDPGDNTVIDSTKLKEMYANEGDHYSTAALNSSSKQLRNKTASNDAIAQVEQWMADFHVAHANSTAGTPGSRGTPGVVSSKSGAKQYFFDANGFEHIQLIEKGLMGCVFYYQTTGVYIQPQKVGPSVDNETVTPGKGTDKQHHWDEAFGYFGVPQEFPEKTDDVRFHGKYCNSRDNLLGLNEKIMDEGFIAGRFAINQKNQDGVDEARDAVSKYYEQVVASTAMHYLNSAEAEIADDALRNHTLSEAYAFIWSLKFNPEGKVSDAQVDAMLNKFGTNLYNISAADIQSIKDDLVNQYPFMSEVKDQL